MQRFKTLKILYFLSETGGIFYEKSNFGADFYFRLGCLRKHRCACRNGKCACICTAAGRLWPGADHARQPYGVHLAGGDATNRVAQSIKDNLYITCVAFKQGEEIFLLYTMDVINASSSVTDPAKAAITQLTGVPGENIMMCATHTHAGVSLTYE